MLWVSPKLLGSERFLPETSDPSEPDFVPGLDREVESSASEVRELSIQHSIHQIQLLFPSLIDAIESLADKHPDIANKIVDDIIRQGEHRQTLEAVVVRGDNRRSTIAQILAWIFAMAALIGSIVLMNSDQSTAGIVVVVVALAPLVGVNIIGSRSARRERVEKARIARQIAEQPSGSS